MQQDNNNIENKLRQLDGQQLPDLSHMDEHWQKMQAMLQPAVPKSNLRINNKGKLIGGGFGIAIITLCYFGYQKINTNKEKNQSLVIAAKTIADSTNLKIESSTPIITDTTFTAVTPAKVYNDKIIYSVIPGSAADGNFIQPNIDFKGNDDSISSITKKDQEIDRAPLLKQLMDQFIKGPQQFYINNARDTVITAAEGTSIYIPANSFGGSNTVNVTVTEYYKKSDIVLNQLNTASNKDQLVTGGMLNITATDKGKEVKINDKTPLRLFMADTSNINMAGMQLFDGDKSNGTINWIPKGQYFSKDEFITEVKVLNIVDQPYKIKQSHKGVIGYFITGDSLKISREWLKKMLKEKYGYYKIKLRENYKDFFPNTNLDKSFIRVYGENIGDSMWMDKATADNYKLVGTATRQVSSSKYYMWGIKIGYNDKFYKGKNFISPTDKIGFGATFGSILDKYAVNITKLGWINCDRFYADTRKKISYQVDLGDSATNYYTMLVFDKLNSMMTGVLYGNKVTFQNIPINEPVKIISIGINKEGETVYSVTSTTTSDQMFTGLKFEKTSAADLKTSLSKLDQ